jgi:hypothetical protein
MISAQRDSTRGIVFLSRNLSGESLRHAEAVRKLAGVHLFGICEHVPGNDSRRLFADLVRVTDARDADQVIAAALGLAGKHGQLHRIVTTHETLLEAAARTANVLGLEGHTPSEVRRVLDKARLKPILRRSGIDTARDRILTAAEDADGFVGDVGFPIVLKPLGGSGGLATWCIRDTSELKLALELMQPSPTNPVLAEEYLRGRELCIDTITIASEPCVSSVCCYRPSILEALENPLIQWSCVMPRDVTGAEYRDFIEQGLAAVRALSIGDAMTHMEGFILDTGGVRFTDATLRPAGARIAPMLAFAYDVDPYLAWARAVVDGVFDGPWNRQYAVGTVFLRGTGRGLVEEVQGIESVKRQLGDLLVDGREPRVGSARSATYTGDGYITVRHPETEAVEDALDLITETVKISYTHSGSRMPAGVPKTEDWRERLQYRDRQLNRPAWEN